MIKIAILDDYQNAFRQIIDLENALASKVQIRETLKNI